MGEWAGGSLQTLVHVVIATMPVGPGACRRSPQAGLGCWWERAAEDSASGWGAGLGVAPRQVFERSGVKPPGAGGPGSRTLRSVLMNGRRPSGVLPRGGRCCTLHPAARGPSPAFCLLLSRSRRAGLQRAAGLIMTCPDSSLNVTRDGSSSRGLVPRGARHSSSLAPESGPSGAGSEPSGQCSEPGTVTMALRDSHAQPCTEQQGEEWGKR